MTVLNPKQLEAVFRAIADPTRREILGLLRYRQHTVGELAGNFRTSRPAISKHLGLLRRVGLVVTKNEGTARICQLNAEPLRMIDDWLRDYQEFWTQSLKSLKRYVEEGPMSTATVDAIVLEIAIQAPAARVFEALVDPAQRMKWWSQKGRFETTNVESDLRPGGRWLMSGIGMGRPFTVKGVYRTIEHPRVLAFTWLPSWDEEATETEVRFDLHEQNGVTTVRLTHSGFATEGSRARHQGWPQILDWLKAYAEG